jgi:hypothetical protein
MARRQDGNLSADRNDGHESSPDKIPRYSNAAQQRDDRKILPKEEGANGGLRLHRAEGLSASHRLKPHFVRKNLRGNGQSS